jgi:sulfate permease, SulP family
MAKRSASTGTDRLAAFAPGVSTLLRYQRGWLRGDLVAGVTVAAYLVPQVMAYAEVAGLPAVVGLWACVAPLLVYAVLGSSRQLSIGPESTTALMTAAAIGALAAGDPERYAALAAGLAVAVGLLCLLGYLGRLGFLADLLSRPVLVGYMAGIAVLMIVSQLGKLTGVDVQGDTPLAQSWYTLRHLGEVAVPTVTMAAVVLVLLLVGQHYRPRWPNPLFVMLLATAATAAFELSSHGIAVVGTIPSGVPAPGLPDLDPGAMLELALPAIGVALVGYSDNVLTARAFATRHRERIDANQEFFALGVANLSSGLFHTFPVSSSASRTAIGDAVGSRSQLYSLVSLVVVLLTLVFLSPVLEAFPLAALAGVVVFAAIRLIDVPELRRIARFRRSELVLAVATIASVLLLGVLPGIGVAIGLSILDLLRRVARPHDGILGYAPEVPGMHDVDDYPQAKTVPGLVVYRYDSPIFFANAEDFRRRALAAVDESTAPTEWFLLNAEANIEVDLTGVDALEEVRRSLAERGIVFAMARVKQDLRDRLDTAGFIERVGEDRIFLTLPTAVAAYAKEYAARHGEPPPGVHIPRPPA